MRYELAHDTLLISWHPFIYQSQTWMGSDNYRKHILYNINPTFDWYCTCGYRLYLNAILVIILGAFLIGSIKLCPASVHATLIYYCTYKLHLEIEPAIKYTTINNGPIMCSCYLLFQIQNRLTEFQIRNEFNELYYSYCKIIIYSKVFKTYCEYLRVLFSS